MQGVPRETGFDITAASEVMAILALATDRGFRRRDTVIGVFWPELDQERFQHVWTEHVLALDGAYVMRP